MDAKIKSLDRALKIIECFSSTNPELGVTEISKMLDMHKSTVFNIIDTFEYRGYLEQNKKTGKYRLGLKILELSHTVYANYDLRNIMNPFLQQIAEETEETVYLGLLSENEVIYLDSVVTVSHVPVRNVIGIKAPLYCTAIGKALLSSLSDDEVKSRINTKLEAITDKTITDIDVLIDELHLIRERGYAIDNMEHEYGIKCISIPINKINGELACAVSISGPSLRFSDETIHKYEIMLKELKSKVERYII